MDTVLKQWNIIRVLRLALGIFILGDGIRSHEPMFIVLGILFSALPILNIGCNGTRGSCATSLPKNEKNSQIEDVTYEEIK